MKKIFVISGFSILSLSPFQSISAQTESTATHANSTLAQNEKMIDRLPEHLLYIYTQPAGATGPSLAENQLVAGKRRWEQGRTLRVCLFGGNASVAKLIRDVASEWNNYGNIKFDFGPEGSWYNCLVPSAGFFQIRVGFTDRGYWSTVGNDAEVRLLPLQPSMNLADFNTTYTDLRQSPNTVVQLAKPYDIAVIRHEFGHAMGLLHEHQNPKLNCLQQIRWKGSGNVFDYLAKPPNNWNPDEVERNLGYVGVTDPDYKAGDPDPKSVMMYSLPAQIFVEGTSSECYVSVNYTISQKDKEIVAAIYPRNGAATGADTGDLDVKTANLSTLPRFVDAPNRKDLLSRIVVDLQSSDKFIRRDARVRLAEVLTRGMTSDEIADLVRQMKDAPYRFQLGVAFALARAHGTIELSQSIKSELLDLSKKTTDLTLKKNLKTAGQ